MFKYIQTTMNILKGLSFGIKKNEDKWTNQPVQAVELDEAVIALENADAEVNTAERVLEQKREAARKLVESFGPKIRQVTNLAIGIHTGEEVKLGEYGISGRKENTSRGIPSKCIINSITDDSDGVGFVITIAFQPGVEHYEIERGIAGNANEVVLAPPYPLYKSTRKTTWVDDDVKKGVRYFYRARAISTSGAGDWSEAVNRVQ